MGIEATLLFGIVFVSSVQAKIDILNRLPEFLFRLECDIELDIWLFCKSSPQVLDQQEPNEIHVR